MSTPPKRTLEAGDESGSVEAGQPSAIKRLKVDNDDAPEPASVPTSAKAQRGRGSKRGRGRADAYKGKSRDNRGTRKDNWTASKPDAGDDDGDDKSSKPRLPKRKCALLLGFCGSGYYGMQRRVYIPSCVRDVRIDHSGGLKTSRRPYNRGRLLRGTRQGGGHLRRQRRRSCQGMLRLDFARAMCSSVCRVNCIGQREQTPACTQLATWYPSNSSLRSLEYRISSRE